MRRLKKALFAFGVLAALFTSSVAHGDESFERALGLASEKRYPEAREVLDPLLEREPHHFRGRLLDGILRAREGRLGDAVEVFEALRRDHPDMAEPYNNLAVILALQGRLDDARTTLLELLRRRPDAVVYANLGDVYTKLANRAYERARELESGHGVRPEPTMDTAFAFPQTTGASPDTDPAGAAARAESHAKPPDDATPTDAATASALSSFCARAGGFANRRAVADAALWLQSYGADVLDVRHEQRQTVGSYRVFLPPLASREAAAAKLREIRGRGVNDVVVIDDGALANGISFGVYRNADNMHRRVSALGRIGYPVRSAPEDVTIIEDYVIRTRVDGAPAALDAAWASRFPGHSIRIVDCG